MTPLAPVYRYHAAVVDIHDGDTLHALIDLGFYTSILVKLRLARLNAPELKAADGSGVAARDYLLSLIPLATGLVVDSIKVDKYGDRWDAEVYRASDGLDVNQDMLDSGHAVPYP